MLISIASSRQINWLLIEMIGAGQTNLIPICLAQSAEEIIQMKRVK